MKILITGFPTLGGSGLVATRLGIELAKLKEYEVHFLFYKEPFFLKEADKEVDFKVHLVETPSYALFSDIGSPFTIQSASKMVEIVKSEKIDLIHSHYVIPHAVSAYLASKNVDVKTVATTHGSDTHTLGELASYQPIVGMALQQSSAVTSVSRYLARETERVFDLAQNSVEVVYNFIEPDEFRPLTNERQKNIIMASNFRPIKQIPLMVEIFACVSDQFPEWKLNLVGYGPEYPVAMRRSRELHIKSKVNFLGVRRDIPTLVSNASILASTSQLESFGLTIAEGMSCETPVFAPNSGGIPEICLDGENGLLFDLENKEDAVEKLTKLMENEELRKKLGQNGRKRIIDQFSPIPIVNKYDQVYQHVLDL